MNKLLSKKDTQFLDSYVERLNKELLSEEKERHSYRYEVDKFDCYYKLGTDLPERVKKFFYNCGSPNICWVHGDLAICKEMSCEYMKRVVNSLIALINLQQKDENCAVAHKKISSESSGKYVTLLITKNIVYPILCESIDKDEQEIEKQYQKPVRSKRKWVQHITTKNHEDFATLYKNILKGELEKGGRATQDGEYLEVSHLMATFEESLYHTIKYHMSNKDPPQYLLSPSANIIKHYRLETMVYVWKKMKAIQRKMLLDRIKLWLVMGDVLSRDLIPFMIHAAGFPDGLFSASMFEDDRVFEMDISYFNEVLCVFDIADFLYDYRIFCMQVPTVNTLNPHPKFTNTTRDAIYFGWILIRKIYLDAVCIELSRIIGEAWSEYMFTTIISEEENKELKNKKRNKRRRQRKKHMKKKNEELTEENTTDEENLSEITDSEDDDISKINDRHALMNQVIQGCVEDTIFIIFLCKGCRKKPRSILFVPCGHILYCNECASSKTNCPDCHKKIMKKHFAQLHQEWLEGPTLQEATPQLKKCIQ